jgi:hypothetical protein
LNVDAELVEKSARLLSICIYIKMLDFFTHNPGSHRIDVKAGDIASDPIGFNEGCAAAHKGISHFAVRKIVACKVQVGKRRVAEFGKCQCPEQAAGTACKPFMDGDDRPVVLLYLFLT